MPNKNTHYKNSAARFILCMMLIAVFFLTAYVVSNWQSNKASVSFQTRSELPNGTKVKPIQDVEVGERAIGRNPQLTDQDRSTFFTDPDPSSWRKLTLEMIKSNGKRLDITLLRPLSWIEEVKAEQGGMIYLDLPEMGAQGDAKVIAIDPCPPIKPGKGNVITGTFHHEAGQTIDIQVQGLDKPIGCTANHPFWSETRHDFVEAGTLRPQEDLLLYDGQITKVIQILPRPGPERVHNLEVLNEHIYYVENVGVLVHNECTKLNIKGLGKTKNIPKKAYTTLFLWAQNPHKKLPGFEPPKKYKNENGRLPRNGNYVECDIERKYEYTDRGTRRIVLDIDSGKAYYTNDHYKTFKEM